MKKLLTVLTLLVLVVMGITACGNETTMITQEEDTTVTTTVTTTEETIATTAPITTEEQIYSLEGKKFLFLGSSVTYGSASGGYSFADEIKKQGRCTVLKRAVSGTTLVDNGPDSYVQRLLTTNKQFKADHVIVQLSTNDASQNKPLGKITADDKRSLEDFDTTTIYGAIEYIICYSMETWNCHVSFYTGTKYDSVPYQRMVNALKQIQKKWGIGIINLWDDPEMNAVSDADYKRWMSDPIHPTRDGYVEWWTPKFIEHLQKYK